MKIPISERLLRCAELVRTGDRVADIGCDHGYLGIYLILNQIASFAIESDIGEQPLKNAEANAARFGCSDKMRFICAPGLTGIPEGEADTVICAGMGADCIVEILSAAEWLKNDRERLVLQPQSSVPELRRYLAESGYLIDSERIVDEKGFLYSIISARYSGMPRVLNPVEYYVSEAILQNGDEMLRKYLRRTEKNIVIALESMQVAVAPPSEKLLFFREALDGIRKLEVDHGLC